MFATYDHSIRSALSFTLIVFFGFSLAHADNITNLPKDVNGAVCNASGECALDISDTAKNILFACETPKVEVTWNRRKNSLFLIACDCVCTSHDNTGWLVEKGATTEKHKFFN